MKPTPDMIYAGVMARRCHPLTDDDVIAIWEAMQRHAPAQPPACWCGKNRDEAQPQPYVAALVERSVAICTRGAPDA